MTTNKQRNERVARALNEAACHHPQVNRGIDLATADEFCGDCGALTGPYTKGMFGRLPGDEAVEIIAAWLREQKPNRAGQVVLQHVQHIGGNVFDVAARVYSTDVRIGEYMRFQLTRADGRVTVTSARH